MSAYADDLTAVVRQADIQQGTPESQAAALRRASNRLAIFDGVTLMSSRGTVTAAEPLRAEVLGQDWSGRQYFRDVVRLLRPAFSDILGDGPAGAPVVVVAVPVIGSQGELWGVAAGSFRLGPTVASPLYGSVVRLRIGGTGYTYLVDGAGRVIYHSDPAQIGSDFAAQPVVQQVLQGQAGAIQMRDEGGRPIVAGFSPVPGTSWGLVSVEAWDALSQAAGQYGPFLLALIALGVLVPVLVMTLGVNRLTKPINDLIRGAEEVARGDFGRTVKATTGDEIEALTEQFNAMFDGAAGLLCAVAGPSGRAHAGVGGAERYFCRVQLRRRPAERPRRRPDRGAVRDGGRRRRDSTCWMIRRTN